MERFHMQTGSYHLTRETVYVTPFFRNYINFMMLFFPVMSFLLVPSIQGTTITTILTSILFAFLLVFPEDIHKSRFVREFFVFIIIFLGFSLISQFFNLQYDLKLGKDLLLVEKGNLLNSFFRSTHVTQAMYLVMSFLVYLFVKYYTDKSVVKFIYYGLRILCLYGIYEIAYFQLTGTTGDFLTNRTFADTEGSGSLSQMMTIAGFNVLRMKSLTGEPSMFAFTVFPFWVLTHVLNRKFDNALLLFCLLLTFSTTAYGAILFFHIGWFFYRKKYKRLIYILGLLLLFLVSLQIDPIREKAQNVYETVFESKLGASSGSGQSRSKWVTRHSTYWATLDPAHQLFGIGFGYIRSTDFLTTILVNCGLIGLLTFSGFFFKEMFKPKIPDRDLHFCYLIGLVGLFFILMLTVPEFGYPSMWIYLALWHVFVKESKTGTND